MGIAMRYQRQRTGAKTAVAAVPSLAVARASGASQRSPPSRLAWLIFWMSGTLVSFIVAAVSVRALAQSLNAFEMMTVRSAGGLAILLAMGLARPQLLRGITFRHMRMQFARNVAHFASQICWTVAIMLLPFATVFALEFTIPAWVTLLAVLFLGERMTPTRAGALAACILGVVIILRPGYAAFQPAALVMIVGALLFAIAAVITKKLIVTESTFSIMVWMNLMQLPMNFAGSDPAFVLRLDTHMILPLIGIASAGLAIHYCLANAFRYGDAMIVVPMDFLRVPLIAVIGWAFYGERIDAFVFAGAAVIVTGVLLNLRGEAQRDFALKRSAMQPAE
jgi:drug/metabolite transporter (DMT)-like permease